MIVTLLPQYIHVPLYKCLLFDFYIKLSFSQLYFILNNDQDIFCDEDGVREFKNNATCPACKLAFNCDYSRSNFFFYIFTQ